MNFREAAPCSLSPLGDDYLAHYMTLDRHEKEDYDDLFTNEFSCYEAFISSARWDNESTSGGLTVAMIDRLIANCRYQPRNRWVWAASYRYVVANEWRLDVSTA